MTFIQLYELAHINSHGIVRVSELSDIHNKLSGDMLIDIINDDGVIYAKINKKGRAYLSEVSLLDLDV